MLNRKNYTRKDMEECAASIIELPKQIENLETSIATDKIQLGQLKQQNEQLNTTQLSPAHVLLNKLKAKIELPTILPQIHALEEEAETLEAQKNSLNAPIDETKQTIAPIKAAITRIERLRELNILQTSLATVNRENRNLVEDCKATDLAVRSAQRSLSAIERNVRSQSAELTALESTRYRLLAELESIRHSTYVESSMQQGRVVTTTPSAVTVNNGGVTVSGVVTTSPSIVQVHSEINHPHHHALGQQLIEIENLINSCNQEIELQRASQRQIQHQIDDLERHLEHQQRIICDNNSHRGHYESEIQNYSDSEQVAARNSSVPALNNQLRIQHDLLSPLERKLSSLTSNQHGLIAQRSSKLNQITQLEYRKNECIKLLEGFELNKDVPLEQQYSSQQALVSQLEKDKEARESEIWTLNRKIGSDESKTKEYKRQLATNETNEYLKLLKLNPQQLLNKLDNDIITAVGEFEREHPYGQSMIARQCLLEMQVKIPFLKEVSSGTDDKSQAIDRYFLLCGFMHTMYLNVNSAINSDKIFSDKITQALRHHEIDLISSMREYNALQMQELRLVDISPIDFAIYEKNTFAEAKDNFQILLDRISPALPQLKRVKTLGGYLLDNINSKIKLAESEKTDFDYKYYTNLFNLAGQLLGQPNNINLVTAFSGHISYHPDEKPSVAYKVMGILSMIAGAILTAAAAVVAVFGFPIGTPLYVSMPVAGVGLGLIAGGIALFCHGNNKGLPGKLNEFVDEVDKHKAQPLLAGSLDAETSKSGPGSYNNLEPSAPTLNM